MSTDRLAELEARVAKLEAILKPAKKRTAKLTEAQRRAIRIQTAADARAAKAVGTGKGTVKDAATRKRLKHEAET
jgi:hypothetical protein